MKMFSHGRTIAEAMKKRCQARLFWPIYLLLLETESVYSHHRNGYLWCWSLYNQSFFLLYIYTKVSTGISVEIVGVTLKRTTKGRVTAFE